MDKKTEALKLALDAFDDRVSLNKWQKARDAVREALAQSRRDEEQPASNVNATGGPKAFFSLAEQPAQQQEPVVWMYVNKSTHETKFQKHMRDFVDHSLWSEVPLYGEPLANHELQCVCGAVWLGDEMVHLPDKRPPAQQQEPVAWKDRTYGNLHHQDFGNSIPLYTSPPVSKPWVGLTEEDIEAAMPGGIYDCLADPWDCGVGDGDYMRSIKNDVVRIVRATEAKLKEKNHG